MKSSSALAAALCALSCGRAPVAGPPQPQGITPSAAHTLKDVPVTIRGSDFSLIASRRLGQGIEVDAGFQAWLGDTPLRDVVWVNEQTLTAVVPAGLSGGPLDLVVQGPTGRGTLVSAFRGAATAPAVLSISLNGPARIEAGQSFAVRASVTNGAQPVVGVTISLSDVAGASVDGVAPQGTTAVQYSAHAVKAGVASLIASAAGTDAFTGEAVTAGSLPLVLQVLAGPSLRAVARPLPAAVDVGQAFSAIVDVFNDGDVDALGVQLAAPASPTASANGAAAVAQDVPAGGVRTFTWPLMGAASGPLDLASAGTATDSFTGLAFPVQVAWNSSVVQRPASVAITSFSLVSSTGLTTLDRGQALTARLTVTNGGEAVATGVMPDVPVIAASGGAGAISSAQPMPVDLAGGSTTTFTWSYRENGTGPGSLQLSAGVSGMDGNTGATVAAPSVSSKPVTVQDAPVLAMTSFVAPSTVTRGQTFLVSMTLKNVGGTSALSVQPQTPALTVGGGAHASTSSAQTASNLAAGATATFSWSYVEDGTGSGTLSFAGAATGTDSNTGGTLTATSATAAVTAVQRPAALSITSLNAPSSVDRGQGFAVSVIVTNTGEATALGVVPAANPPAITASGGAATTTPAAAAAQAIAGGASATFTFNYLENGSAAGTLTFSAGATGTDANSAAALTAASASASTGVQRPAALTLTSFTLRSSLGNASIDRGQSFTATLVVANTGDAAANGVLPALPTAALTGGAAAATSSSPAAQTIPGGSSATFTWSYLENGGASGTLQLTTSLSGTDANTGAGVGLGSAQSETLLVQDAAALAVTSFAVPPSLSRGQSFSVLLTVKNTGGATAAGVQPQAPVLTATGGAHATTASAPTAVALAAGTSTTFTWSYVEDGTSTGTISFSSSIGGTDSNTGAALAGNAGPAIATVQRPAALSISSLTAPAAVDRGQTFPLSIVVANGGDATALGVVPSPNPPSGIATGGAATSVPAALAGVSIAGGATATFNITYVENGTSSGTLSFSAGATGTDANSGAVSSASSTSASVLVQRPAILSASSFTLRSALNGATINRGQAFTATLVVANSGEAAANAVAPAPPALTVTGGATASTSSAPAAQTIPGGGSATFSWTYVETGTGAGTIQLRDVASGVDANSGAAVSLASASSDVATVQTPASLSATASVPGLILANQTFNATVTVTNSGGGTVNALTPVSFTLSGPATITGGPAPASTTLSGGGSVTFTWTCQSTTLIGTVNFSATVAGTDANDGSARSASATTSGSVSEVSQLASNPFGDGSSFAYLFDFNGRIYLGPGKTGSGAVRMLPDGSVQENVSFSIYGDAGNQNSNNSGAPYPSFGYTGCAPNTAQCGPDNEDGRGMFAAGIIAGTPWIISSGSRSSGGLAHLYLTPDTTTTPAFDYIGTSFSSEIQGTSAMAIFHDRIYLGYPSNKGNRPFFTVINRTPVSPGYDASAADAADLNGTKMPSIGAGGSPKNNAGTQMIDAIFAFNDLLYLGNNGGWVRSTNNNPSPYQTSPGDWAVATPSAAAYGAKTSATTSKLADLTPADRALPAMAALGGKLYAARNTTSGPQLWVCTPGATLACDPVNWLPLAPNTSGDTMLSQFNDTTNSAITLLAATSAHLFVGFDNGSGVRIYRSTTTAPASLADFTGQGGCSASSTSCQGLGGNGLGAGVTHIFDSRALTYNGQDYLYLTAGTGTAGVRVFRTGG